MRSDRMTSRFDIRFCDFRQVLLHLMLVMVCLQEREVKTEEEVRTRTKLRKENWCSRKMDKVRVKCQCHIWLWSAFVGGWGYIFFFCTEYAQVTKMLGNGRLEAMCFDGVKRLCHIRGKLRKKVWINQGDIILIGLRDYQDAKADVILKYTSDEARNLKTYGEFPETGKWHAISVSWL